MGVALPSTCDHCDAVDVVAAVANDDVVVVVVNDAVLACVAAISFLNVPFSAPFSLFSNFKYSWQ